LVNEGSVVVMALGNRDLRQNEIYCNIQNTYVVISNFQTPENTDVTKPGWRLATYSGVCTGRPQGLANTKAAAAT
jgi:hypothetical protein